MSKLLRVVRLAPIVVAMGSVSCTVISLREVPIVEKSQRRAPTSATAIEAPAASAPLTRETKDGSYIVQRGDTLYSIALAFGQDWREIARWNELEDPGKLQVGQALRVVSSPDAAMAASVPVVVAGSVEARPLDAPTAIPSAAAIPSIPPVSTAPAVPPKPARDPSIPLIPPVAVDPASPWGWPAVGKVVEPFNEVRNKGIDIAGKEGDAVMAANDGQVVYTGSSLRGYGNLVIVKHTDDFVSAYAHNKEILVQPGQAVKRGQRIARLGSTDADQPKLHFEIRRQGKPIDPVKYLPARP